MDIRQEIENLKRGAKRIASERGSDPINGGEVMDYVKDVLVIMDDLARRLEDTELQISSLAQRIDGLQ